MKCPEVKSFHSVSAIISRM